MRIERIVLKRFLLFEDAEVRFGRGLNVVLSPNEGGKSSLMRGIVTALYRDASSKSRDIKALRRWGSEASFRIEIDLRLGCGAFRVVRDFEERTQEIFREGETDPFLRGRAVDEYLKSHLPLPDENLFLKVCGVHQERLAISDGKFAIGEKLEEILGGGWGEATPEKVKRLLEDARNRLRRGIDRPAGRENWGPVKRISSEIAVLEGRLEEAEEIAGHREELLRTLSAVGRELGKLEGDIELLGEKSEKAVKYNDLLGREKEAKRLAEDKRKRKERLWKLLEERAVLRKEEETFLAVLLDSDESECRECRDGLAREKSLKEELRIVGKHVPARLDTWRLAASAVLLLIGILGAVFLRKAFLMFAAAGFLMGAWLFIQSSIRGRGSIFAGKEAELAILEERRRGWAGDRSIEEASELLERFYDYRKRLNNIGIRLDEAAGVRSQDADYLVVASRLDEEYGESASEWHALKKERKQLELFCLDADGLLKLEREIEKTGAEIDDLRKKISRFENELAGMRLVDAGEIMEHLASRRSDLESAERKLGVVDIVLDALEDARRGMAGFLAGRLPPLAGELISRITDGRYDRILIDPVTLMIETVPADDDISDRGDAGTVPEAVDLSLLSQGARDQVYLAVRLALVELLSGQEPQPVFLDDPLVHFDSRRRGRAVEIIQKLAERHQIILLTCNPEYGDLGGTVIRLDSGTD